MKTMHLTYTQVVLRWESQQNIVQTGCHNWYRLAGRMVKTQCTLRASDGPQSTAAVVWRGSSSGPCQAWSGTQYWSAS